MHLNSFSPLFSLGQSVHKPNLRGPVVRVLVLVLVSVSMSVPLLPLCLAVLYVLSGSTPVSLARFIAFVYCRRRLFFGGPGVQVACAPFANLGPIHVCRATLFLLDK